jgi:hypothetical protein
MTSRKRWMTYAEEPRKEIEKQKKQATPVMEKGPRKPHQWMMMVY